MYLSTIPQEDMEYLLKICWSIEQCSEAYCECCIASPAFDFHAVNFEEVCYNEVRKTEFYGL